MKIKNKYLNVIICFQQQKESHNFPGIGLCTSEKLFKVTTVTNYFCLVTFPLKYLLYLKVFQIKVLDELLLYAMYNSFVSSVVSKRFV
jgi:hypothetical protein